MGSEMIVRDAGRRTRSLGSKKFTADSKCGLVYDSNKISVNDGTNDRVLMGERDDGTYGIDISQEGADVKTADTGDLVMSSSLGLFKIVSKGTGEVDPVAGEGTTTVTHNLGFVPVVFFYVTDATESKYRGVPIFLEVAGTRTQGHIVLTKITRFDWYANTTQLVARINTKPAGAGGYEPAWDFRYYLTKEIGST